MRYPMKLSILLCACVLLTACGGGSGGNKNTSSSSAASSSIAAPSANAGADQSVDIGSTVALDGSASTSPRAGASLTYQWSFVNKPAASGAVLSDTATDKPTFVADVPGTYELELAVGDGTATASDRVVITVNNPDPVAVVRSEYSELIGTTVSLDASASTPPTGGDIRELVYKWAITEKPNGSVTAIAQNGAGVGSLYLDVAGTYKARLQVRYQDKTSLPVDITITANLSNTKPVANAGGPYTVVRGQTITLDGTASSDADGDTLSYRWYTISPSDKAGVATPYIPNGSNLRAENAIQEYNTATPSITPDVVGSWNVFLTVYDGTSISDIAMGSITVTKPEDAPNTAPVASFQTSRKFNFFTPGYADEVELGVVVWSSGNSWDIDGGYLSGTNRSYRWIQTPAGYNAVDLTGLGSFSFTPTVAGQYTVEMTVNDGELFSAPAQRTFTARTGANTAPTASVAPDASTIMVGSTGWFDARASSDKEGDQLTYQWLLFDKPDGSNATLRFENVTREDGTVLQNARAGVVADKPGAYIVLLAVTDSHGTTSVSNQAQYGRILAKASNNAPTIERVSNNNDHQNIRRTNTHYNDSDQPYIVGDENLTLFAINPVDPDLDALYFLWTLEQPGGSSLTDAGVNQNFNPGAPTVPGLYTATAIASDGITPSAAKSLSFKVVDRANYPSLLLEDHYTGHPINSWDRNIRLGNPADTVAFPRHRAFPYWHHDDVSFPVHRYMLEEGDNLIKNYRLTAYGGDYTIKNLNVTLPRRPGAQVFTGKFQGLTDGQVIRQGETVEFSLVLVAPANAGDLDPGEDTQTQANGIPESNILKDMIYSFEIAEKAGWTFEYSPATY